MIPGQACRKIATKGLFYEVCVTWGHQWDLVMEECPPPSIFLGTLALSQALLRPSLGQDTVYIQEQVELCLRGSLAVALD